MKLFFSLFVFSVFIDIDLPIQFLEQKSGRSGNANQTYLWALPKSSLEVKPWPFYKIMKGFILKVLIVKRS